MTGMTTVLICVTALGTASLITVLQHLHVLMAQYMGGGGGQMGAGRMCLPQCPF